MGRSPCCSKVGLRRGPWSTKEDTILADYIQQHGEGQWRSLPKNAGLLRCGKSCRLRWMNYLRPGIKRGNISEDEEDLILRLHKLLGNRWSLIAGRLPGRTDNEIKNYWNTHLLKKQLKIPNNTIMRKNKKKKKKKKDLPTLPLPQKNDEIIMMPTKVYFPKPIRLISSSTLSRTNSFSSSDATCPLFQHHDDFIKAPSLYHHSQDENEDINMWEKVYHEYLQLL